MSRGKSEADFQKLHRTEWQSFLWDRFLEKSPESADLLFSKYEKGVVAKRLAALALIRTGVGSREIGRTLWMSQATISALRKSFFSNSGDYKSQRSLKASKRKNSSLKSPDVSWLDRLFKDIDIWELLKNPPRPASLGVTGRSSRVL